MSDLHVFNDLKNASDYDNVQKKILSQMQVDMDRFVPRRQGHLRNEVYADGSSLVYKMPYARAQFYGLVGAAPGYPVHNYTTPGTGKRWDLRAKSVYMPEWQQVARNATMKELRG